MLRITVQDSDQIWRMRIEGKLVGVWVAEAKAVWDAAPAGKVREIDLKGVTCVDGLGEALLQAMSHSGAKLIAAGVRMSGLIKDMAAGLVVVVLAAMSLASPASAQTPPAPLRITLKEAVALALKQNPQVIIANLNLVQSGEDSKIARSALLPQISLNASEKVTRGNIEALFGKRVPGLPGHNGPFWTTQVGPGFSTPLFDLSLWNRWQAARQAVQTSAAQEITARELNAQLVVSQYLGGLRAAAEVDAAKVRVDLAKALFDLASDLQKNGVGTGIDTLRANVEFQNETQRYTEASTQLTISLFGLGRLLNIDPEQRIELADSASFFETPSIDASRSLSQAYIARPEMKAIQSQMLVADLEKRAAKNERLPRLALNGGWTLQGVTPTSMIPAYQFGASVEVPLFTGGRIQAETAIADIELKKLTQTQIETRNEIALEVKTAAAQIDSARTQVDTANLGLSLARESVRQAQDRFRAGVANNIEVITAQNELARANDNQIAALYRYNQSRADLARATGQMESLYAR